MQFVCTYRFIEGLSRTTIENAFLRQVDATGFQPDQIRAWFGFADGSGGTLLVESANPFKLRDSLTGFSDVVTWEVHPAYVNVFTQVLQELEAKRCEVETELQ